MQLIDVVREAPDRAAIVSVPDGTVVTFRELEDRSNQVAHLLRARGLRVGNRIAILSENRVEYLVLAWGAQRSGLQYVGVNSHLTTDEVAYIIEDSEVDVLVVSESLVDLARQVVAGTGRAPKGRFVIGRGCDGFDDLEAALDGQPITPIPDEAEGDFMLYSSGTTGRPKGIERQVGGPIGSNPDIPGRWMREMMGMQPGDVFLSPAPLYHSAPLAWTMGAHRSGATAVIMQKFDAELSLSLIEDHRVTHSLWVPTMFVRMLKLPEETRRRFDLTSLRHAVHGAAPCPVEVKRDMIGWWGPILFEYYGSTEGVGAAVITSAEWLQKPGSVGRSAVGTAYVTDDDGNDLPPGEIGTVWFTGGLPFDYHGDPGKTRATHDQRGGASVGDLGYLDEDGYLFLSDRRHHLIISGGVNIYPQEIEDALVLHPSVTDVGVVGVPDPEMGERVVAVVQATASSDDELAEELRSYARSRLAKFKVPRDFLLVDELPRMPAGKLRKHEIQQYALTALGMRAAGD